MRAQIKMRIYDTLSKRCLEFKTSNFDESNFTVRRCPDATSVNNTSVTLPIFPLTSMLPPPPQPPMFYTPQTFPPAPNFNYHSPSKMLNLQSPPAPILPPTGCLPLPSPLSNIIPPSLVPINTMDTIFTSDQEKYTQLTPIVSNSIPSQIPPLAPLCITSININCRE